MPFEVEKRSDIDAVIGRATKLARELVQPEGFEKGESLGWETWKKLDKYTASFYAAHAEYEALKKEKDVDNSEKIADCLKQMNQAIIGFLKKYSANKGYYDYCAEGARMGKIFLALPEVRTM